MPEEWMRSILVPIFKNNGDVQSCTHYRGIKLMSHTMKLWERVIEHRLRRVTRVTQNQFGFMPGSRGGFRPQATRAMARGSAQKIFFFNFFELAQPNIEEEVSTDRAPLPFAGSPQPRRRLSRTPVRHHRTTRIRGSAPTPSPQPPPASGDGRRQRPPSALRSGLRRQAQGAGGQAGSGRRQPAAGRSP